VLCSGGIAKDLSVDHKPNNLNERKRIQAAGGHVLCVTRGTSTQYRVNGNLNLSRALGDLQYKMQKELGQEAQLITCWPDVAMVKRGADEEFVVLACDGVWDVKSSQEVVDFIRCRLDSCQEVSAISEALLDACISPDPRQTNGLGCDNMTCVIIDLMPGRRSRNKGSNFVGPYATPSTSVSSVTLDDEENAMKVQRASCPVPQPFHWLLGPSTPQFEPVGVIRV
jgi:protein phosphatase 1G